MEIKLTHRFKEKCFDKNALFSGMYVNGELTASKCKLNSYMKAVKEQAFGIHNYLEGDRYRWPPANYIGDGFELFVECLIKVMGTHTDIGIVDYIPQPTTDNGVDGVGKNILNLKTTTVQVKYKSDETVMLTAGKDRLDSFFTSSIVDFDIEYKRDANGVYTGPRHMVVITSAEDMHYWTKEVKFKNAMRCLHGPWLRSVVDGNIGFWTIFINLMNER